MKNRGFLLIVEDRTELRQVLCELFTPLVAQVESAQNGEEALYKMENNPYINCVIADIKLPKVDGMKLLKLSRDNKILTPFVMLTAYAASNYRKEAMDLGAFDLIEKPFRVEKLMSVVQQAIEINLRSRGQENITDLVNKDSAFATHYVEILKDKKPA